MSRSYEYSYELERARRQAIYNKRVSETTERFYRKYIEQYNVMKNNGYFAYIPDEMNRLKSDLSTILELLVSNPTEARNLSFEVGSYIRNMSSMAKVAVEQFDRAERMRREHIREQEKELKNELMQTYFNLLKEITNPIVINYAQNDLEKVKQEIQKGSNYSVQSLKNRIDEVIATATKKAEEWKRNTILKQKKENIISKLDETEQQLLNEKIENTKKTQEFINSIKELKNNISSNVTDVENVEHQINELENRIDDTLITEEVRREAVKAIIKQLKSQEFSISSPKIVQDGEDNYVKIVAQRPSGKRAICRVDLHGKIAYKFDNYEGMTCLKDIEKFNVDLEQIYSIKLSDERILWSNPDKLSKDSERLPKNGGRYV